MESFAQCLRHKPFRSGSDSLLFFQIWVWVCPSHLGEWGQADAQSPSAYQTQSPFPSEGSVIAYYWSEFNIPNYLVEEAERAMAEEHAVKLPPRTRTLHSFILTSVVAFRECRAAGGGRLVGQAVVEQGKPLLLGECREEKTVLSGSSL